MRPSTADPRDRITVEDPRSGDVRKLLDRHFSHARAHTPPDEIYALDVDGLADPAVTLFSFRSGGALLGIAALKRLDAEHAELKSMHTVRAATAPGRQLVRFVPVTVRSGPRRVGACSRGWRLGLGR